MIILLLIFSGFICGGLSKIYGLGGGLTITPILLYTLPLINVPDDRVYSVTISTSVTVMLFNSFINTIRDVKQLKFERYFLFESIFYVFLGCFVGCSCISYLNRNIGITFFLIFIILINISFYSKISFYKINSMKLRGLLCGIVSSWIGGGSSLMMYRFIQSKKNVSDKVASIYCNFLNMFIAIFCVIFYFISSSKIDMSGFLLNIYLKGFMCLVIGSLIGSTVFAWLDRNGFFLKKDIVYRVILIIINFSIFNKFMSEVVF